MAALGDLLAQVEDLDAQLQAVDDAELVAGKEEQGIVEYVDPETGESVELTLDELETFRKTLAGAKKQLDRIVNPYTSAKKAYDDAQAGLRRAQEIARNPITESPEGISQAQADKNVVAARKKVEAAGRRVNVSVRRVEATQTPDEVVQAATAGPTGAATAVPPTEAIPTPTGEPLIRATGTRLGGDRGMEVAQQKRRNLFGPTTAPSVGGGGGGTGGGAGGGTDTGQPKVGDVRTTKKGVRQEWNGSKWVTVTVETKPWQQIIQEEFGSYAAYIGIDPDVDKALEMRAKGEIDSTRFQAMIRSTAWWRDTNDFIRAWDLKERTPGSTAQKEIADRTQAMMDHAMSQFGVALAPESLRSWARQSLREGASDLTWKNGVGAIIAKGGNAGVADQLRNSSVSTRIRDINAKYGYNVSADTVMKAVNNIVMGVSTEAMYENDVAKQVKSLYGQDVGQLLDQGYSLKDIMEPYTNVAKTVLQLDDIDLQDEKFRRALQVTDPQGNKRKMTLGEWERNLRTDASYGWEYTENARTQARRTVDTILKSFGKVS